MELLSRNFQLFAYSGINTISGYFVSVKINIYIHSSVHRLLFLITVFRLTEERQRTLLTK